MKRLIPSMFHRRLVLIGAAYAVALVGLGVQFGRISLVSGEEHRARAESRIRSAEWLPTTRGRILDRHGRILAHDRACYHVAVDYPVISGAWARRQALAHAQSQHGRGWSRLSRSQQEQLAERFRPALDRHVQLAWERLASMTGVSPDDLAAERESVIESVESVAGYLRAQWERQFLAEHARTGRSLADDDRRRLERLRSQETAEQRTPQILVRSVSDETAFTLLRMAEQRITLDISPDQDGSALRQVPLLPGLAVRDGATREYPFESMVVDVDQSSLPLPIRADGRRSVAVVGVLSDVLGWTGSPTARTLESRAARREQDTDFAQRTTGHDLTGMIDLGQYVTGDQAGVRGIEASWESDLRGLRGRRIIRRDTDESSAIEAAPGMDVRLTIDAMLQARVQAAMSPGLGLARVQAWHGNHALPSGTPLSGAAVVLDVDTGEVLAMVSTPAATPAERRRAEARAMRRERDWIRARDAAAERGEPPPAERYDSWRDPDAMLQFNRAVGVPYPPGSIAKVVVLLEAVRRGAYSITERIACTGHLVAERPDMLRCWIFKRYATTHNATYRHDLSAAEALTASCNVFFYTLGRRLGAEGIAEAYSRWGVGTTHNLGVGPAARGQIEPRTIQQAILLGIGQGPLTWTPMHAADAMATIARGGVRLPVRIAADTHGEPEDLGLDPRAIAAVIEGLHGAVHDGTHGTGHHITFTVAADGRPAGQTSPATREIREPIFNVPGVRIVGKTGTATAGPIVRVGPDGAPILDDEGEEEKVIPDHSWYVALVGPETGPSAGRFRYAVAVMMEHAGSGGKVSGPICNQIIHALVAEGYLPGPPATAASVTEHRR